MTRSRDATGRMGADPASVPGPQVSVILPTYRRPAFLERAIASVERQSLQAWDLIIVDDNHAESRERRDTEAVVARFASDGRIRYVQHARNLGGGAARNTGIRTATTPFVAFLDDDDEWHPTKLERQLARILASPSNVGLVYCRVRKIETATGRESMTRTDGRSHSVRQLLMSNTIGSTSCILCRVDALHAVGLFDETLPSRQDIDLYVRLAERYAFAFVDEPLVTFYRHDEASISTNIEASIRAHQLFLAKHRDRIEADPEVLRVRLQELGRLLVWAKRYPEARSVFLRAWRLRPTSIGVTIGLAMTFAPARMILRAPKRALDRMRSRGLARHR
jgi:glycosyltransferase involved in cell wall biosynthesis